LTTYNARENAAVATYVYIGYFEVVAVDATGKIIDPGEFQVERVGLDSHIKPVEKPNDPAATEMEGKP